MHAREYYTCLYTWFPIIEVRDCWHNQSLGSITYIFVRDAQSNFFSRQRCMNEKELGKNKIPIKNRVELNPNSPLVVYGANEPDKNTGVGRR